MTLLCAIGFNEGSGLVSADSSGNGRNFAASNSSTSWETSNPKYGAAAARTQHTGTPGPNSSLTAWTMMAWVLRTGTWTGFAAAFGKNNWYVEVNQANSYEIDFWGGTNNQGIGAGVLLPLNTWTHVAVTRNATDGLTRLYVNGALVSGAVANAAQNFGTGTWGVALTAATAAEDANFVGAVDDFRTLDVDLSASEITDYANLGIGTFVQSGILLQENGHPLLQENQNMILI